jgi:hypothetical protein
MFPRFFFGLQWATLIGRSSKNSKLIPLLAPTPKGNDMFLHYLHKHVKSHKYNCLILTLLYTALNIFTQFYTYMECKS